MDEPIFTMKDSQRNREVLVKELSKIWNISFFDNSCPDKFAFFKVNDQHEHVPLFTFEQGKYFIFDKHIFCVNLEVI
jgi:hypothetical protein